MGDNVHIFLVFGKDHVDNENDISENLTQTKTDLD